jgi:gas vesicle protein
MNGNILLGFLGGFAAGMLVGVLVAPDEGSETIDKLSEDSGEYLKEIKEKYSSIIEGLNEKLDELRERASHVMNESAVDSRFTV